MTDLDQILNDLFAEIKQAKDTPAYLVCSTCRYPKGTMYFREDRSRKRGYEYDCKKCQKEKYQASKNNAVPKNDTPRKTNQG